MTLTVQPKREAGFMPEPIDLGIFGTVGGVIMALPLAVPLTTPPTRFSISSPVDATQGAVPSLDQLNSSPTGC